MNIRLGRKGPHNKQPEEHGGNCFDDLCKDSPLLFWIRERERERERESKIISYLSTIIALASHIPILIIAKSYLLFS